MARWHTLVTLLYAMFTCQQVGVIAQITSNVVCTTALWTINKGNQNPCLIAASLMGVCHSGTFQTRAFPPSSDYSTWEYIGAGLNTSESCACNTVTYSMYAACGVCQGGTHVNWPEWSINCTSSYVATFPLPLLPGYNVPAWAFLDLRVSGQNWDYLSSERIALMNVPEVTGGSSPTRLTLPTALTQSSTSTSASASAPHASTTVIVTKSINSAAITVGVVLGVVVAVLVGALLYARRNSGQRKEPATVEKAAGGGMNTYTGTTPGTHSAMSSPANLIFPQPTYPALPEV